MADPNDRTSGTSAADANRARMQGLGSGQRDMDAGRDPSRVKTATAPEQRSFDRSLDGAANSGEAETPEVRGNGPSVEGDLGVGTPANVDVHKLGQEDRPQEDWGEPADAEATFSSNHTRRPIRTEADRGQGAKTRRANKDIVSRRS